MRMASTNTAVNPLFFVDSGVVIARKKQYTTRRMLRATEVVPDAGGIGLQLNAEKTKR